jgi:Raf kinase inhibitor-like YbhB/YbcL family protein
MAFSLTSPEFTPGGALPRAITCEGAGRSPALEWSGAPDGTRSLALIADDPDAPDPRAPKRDWVHWVLFDIPPSVTSLPENSAAALPAGTRPGRNESGDTAYEPPCPPIGRHRYFFRLYALDRELGVREHPTRGELLDAMQGHVLAVAELMGTFARSG